MRPGSTTAACVSGVARPSMIGRSNSANRGPCRSMTVDKIEPVGEPGDGDRETLRHEHLDRRRQDAPQRPVAQPGRRHEALSVSLQIDGQEVLAEEPRHQRQDLALQQLVVPAHDDVVHGQERRPQQQRRRLIRADDAGADGAGQTHTPSHPQPPPGRPAGASRRASGPSKPSVRLRVDPHGVSGRFASR